MLKRPEDEKFQTLILFFFPYNFGKRFRFLDLSRTRSRCGFRFWGFYKCSWIEVGCGHWDWYGRWCESGRGSRARTLQGPGAAAGPDSEGPSLSLLCLQYTTGIKVVAVLGYCYMELRGAGTLWAGCKVGRGCSVLAQRGQSRVAGRAGAPSSPPPACRWSYRWWG